MYIFKKDLELEIILSKIDELDLPDSDRENITRKMRRFMFLHNALTVFYVVTFFASWFALFYALLGRNLTWLIWAVGGMLFTFFVMGVSARTDMKHGRSYSDILFKECNSQKALVVYKMLFSHISYIRRVEPDCFNNMIVCLRQCGYDELAEEILNRLKDYNPHPQWQAVININLIKAQFIKGDHQAALEGLAKEIKREEVLVSEITGLSKYLESNRKNYALLQMYVNKEYDKLSIVLEDRINNQDKTNLEKVRDSFYAYGVAEKLKDKEKANKHLDFVAKNSGTICFDKPFPVL